MMHRLPAGFLCRTLLVAGALLLGRPAPAAPAAPPPPLVEHQIKALYLFNFTKYVDWPDLSSASNGTPFVIGISDAPEIHSDLQEITRGKRILGREIVVRKITAVGEVKVCQLLFIGTADKRRLAELLKTARELAVLTVGEAEDFLAQGGVINFVRQDNKMRVEISLDAAHSARLVVSAKLLAVARAIKGHAEEPRK